MALSIKVKVKAKGAHAEKLVRQLSGGLPKVKKMHAPAAKKHGNPRY